MTDLMNAKVYYIIFKLISVIKINKLKLKKLQNELEI